MITVTLFSIFGGCRESEATCVELHTMHFRFYSRSHLLPAPRLFKFKLGACVGNEVNGKRRRNKTYQAHRVFLFRAVIEGIREDDK